MGKGTRNRQKRVDEMLPVIEAHEDAKRYDRIALIIGIVLILCGSMVSLLPGLRAMRKEKTAG